MPRRVTTLGWAGLGGLCVGLLVYGLGAAQAPQTPPPSGKTYFPVLEQDYAKVRADDLAAKPTVMERQRSLLAERYDLANRRGQAVMMAGGRKAVQQGVRVKLPAGLTWERLAAMSPDEIREKDLFPQGFLPLPHVKHTTGGMIFPAFEIAEINKQEARSLERFDADFDLPDHLLPEFPPPMFLTTRPELGDVSRGQLLTIRNYFAILDGILTPVQMEGMRLLLTPFPQQQFNQTDDRKTDVQSLGVTCLDCHSNGHTNAAFHQTPDIRPQAARFRIETVSLRGRFTQLTHGSKRSLSSRPDVSRQPDARSEGGALLQAAHDQRSVDPRRGPHQDLHPSGDQGLPAIHARRAPLDAGGHGRVLQPRSRRAADAAGEGGACGLHAPVVAHRSRIDALVATVQTPRPTKGWIAGAGGAGIATGLIGRWASG